MSRGRQSAGGLTGTDLAEIRRSLRASAREGEEGHLATLEAAMAGPGVMKAPAALQRERTAGGGVEHRSREASDYDWFWGLGKAEQGRLRERWFAPDGKGEAPDEIAGRIDLPAWLEHTRRADASRALATGHHVSAGRHGGLNPNSLIAGSPYDARKIWGGDREALAHVRSANRGEAQRERRAERGPGVEFFTDSKGRVHPIRASEPASLASGSRYAPTDHGADEAF